MCYMDNLENKDRYNKIIIHGNKKEARKTLTEIIDFAEKKETIEIAAEVLNKCEKCRFENPEIFKYLDEKKMVSS